MKLKLTIFWIEFERIKSKIHVRVIILSALVSYLISSYLLRNMLYISSDAQNGIIIEYETNFLLLVGIVLILFMLYDIDLDYSSGIISNYLLHPIKPKEIILSKILAGYIFYLPALIIPFSLLIVLSPDFNHYQVILILIGTLINFLVIIYITLISVLLIKYRPLSEVLSLILIIIYTLFNTLIPFSLLYFLNPAFMYFLKLFGGKISMTINPIFIIGGIFFDLVLIIISIFTLDRIQWSY